MKNVLVITGSRAEYGLLLPLIKRMLGSKKVLPQVLVTGMHVLERFGYTIKEIKLDKIPIKQIVLLSDNDDMAQSLAKEIVGIRNYCSKNKVDGIIILGDRDEPFAGAIVGRHLNIPVIHISGGDVSGPTVDHYLRNAITIFSSLHLTQTKKSKVRVVSLGANPKNTHVVGSLGLDGLVHSKLVSQDKLARKYGLDIKLPWFLFVMHPTPFEDATLAEQISGPIKALKGLDGQKIIIYPNSDTGGKYLINRLRIFKKNKHFFVTPNMAREDYLGIMASSDVLIGNTSSGLIEGGYLKIPFVHIGNRQKGREYGANVIFCGYQENDIMAAIVRARSVSFKSFVANGYCPYQGGEVAKRMLSIIEDFLYGEK